VTIGRKKQRYLAVAIAAIVILSFIGYEVAIEPPALKPSSESFLNSINASKDTYNFTYWSSSVTYYVINCSDPSNIYYSGMHVSIAMRIVKGHQSLSFPVTGIPFNLSLKYYVNNATFSCPGVTHSNYNSTYICHLWSFGVPRGNTTYEISGFIAPVYEISFIHFRGLEHKFIISHRIESVEN
jgi:hypothetical protein